MTKTDKMLLIEAKAGRDVRDVLAQAYGETRSLEGACAWIETQYGVSVTLGVLHGWIRGFGGTVLKTIEWPTEAAVA